MELFRPAIIMPTYNNARTLPEVLARTLRLKLPIVIVNDGCTDGTDAWLARREWEADDGSGRVEIVTHGQNKGKAEALRSGFARAAAMGFTHAGTLDTDGQLDPEDLPRLLDEAARQPTALVVGARDDLRPDYPARSRIGRRLSNLAIRLECGARVLDSQCGLRVYPLKLFEVVRCNTGRFGFEAEIITRAAWAGCPIVNVPVNCRYFGGVDRVTHYKVLRDNVHGVLLHGRLLGRAMWPAPHPRIGTDTR